MRMDREQLFLGALIAAAAASAVLFAAALTGLGGFAGILIPLFVFIASLGFILPLATALAMAPHGRNAGSASALIGVLQFTLGAAAGISVGILHDGSARPMTLVIAMCGCGAVLIRFLLARTKGPAGD